MPYMLKKEDGKICVCKKNADNSPGESLHCYEGEDAESKAKDYMKALYSHEPKHMSNNSALQIRYEHLDGRKFLVAPGVAVKEQVLNNYLLPAEEIGHFYEAWNGVPITLRHPKQNNGSAAVPNPDVPIIGRFYNAKFDGDKLTGEYWIDEQLIKQHSMDMYNKIISGSPVETSTGYYSDDEEANGVFNNISYEIISRNLRPNHVAILPDEIGACSVQDGCGVNKNNKGVTMNLQELLAKLTGKGIKVKINEEQGKDPSFEIEETKQPDPPAPVNGGEALFSKEEIAALKALATSAPVLQNAATVFATETKARKDSLIASIKQNTANVFSDEELSSMSVSALEKHNAHLNTNFMALGGAEINQNNSNIAVPPDTFKWVVAEQGGK